MRWLSRRARVFLFAVFVFLALAVMGIGVLRAVNPELNLMQELGLVDEESTTTFRANPSWVELTQEQRDSLSPLKEEWEGITPVRKKKWLKIAQRMESMSLEEKARVQERIQLWVSLTPEQRREARQNYLNAKKLDIKDKSLQWLEYQSLPEEQKKELADATRKKYQGVTRKGSGEPVAQKAAGEADQRKKEETPDYWR